MSTAPRWGVDDEAGALNEITAAKVVQAVSLVQRGEVHDLAQVLDRYIPAFPGRTFQQELVTRGGQDIGRNHVNFVVERITATQQMGTHMDGLNHLHRGEHMYNGYRLADVIEDHGTNKLGIDSLPQVVTRGVLLDIAKVRGVELLEPGDVITVSDAEAALNAAGLAVTPGDAVLFHTGWGGLWGVDNERYAAGEPGPGQDLGAWLADHRVAVTGCDTWSYGPYPAEDPDEPFVVPQRLNVDHGIVVLENLRLHDAAQRGLTEFLLVVSHAKIRGATGAWVCPLAII